MQPWSPAINAGEAPYCTAQLGAPNVATVVLQDVEAGLSIASTNLVAITNTDQSVTTNASFGVVKSSGSNVVIMGAMITRANPTNQTVTVASGMTLQVPWIPGGQHRVVVKKGSGTLRVYETAKAGASVLAVSLAWQR